MTATSKWIQVDSPDVRVRAVAERTVEVRLEAVRHFLPLAADHADEDVEYVHQLRVATRRCVAALDLYGKLFPKESRKALGQRLKAIRRAAGRARDFDVLLLRHASQADSPTAEQFVSNVRGRRVEAQTPLREIHQQLAESNELPLLLQQMFRTKPATTDSGSPSFRGWATTRLDKTVRTFFAAEPRNLSDLESLHAFRIRGKELRYAMEMLVGAFPKTFQTRLYPLIERLQERLGSINDHAVAVKRFRDWAEETADPVVRKHLQSLIKKERRELRKSLFRFACWWTPGRSKQVHRRFRRFARAV
jgi:CHAD domain-containing protein